MKGEERSNSTEGKALLNVRGGIEIDKQESSLFPD